jgi:RHS repeat-associated protein
MTNETVTKSGRFYCVSLTPDICKTPVGASTPPLPYTIVGEFAEAKSASPNVKSHSEPVVLHERTTIPTVKGDAPGSAGGVKSGTVGKQVDTKASSSTHHANGANLVQVGREVWMNARNTVGKIYERGGESARPLLAALKPIAQAWKDDFSAPAHDAGERLMDVGGKVALGGAATAGTGALMSATVVGAPLGVPMAAAGGAVAGVGSVAAAGGAFMETAVTFLDQGAEYALTGKTPHIWEAALNSATSVAEGYVFKKLGPLGRWLSSKSKGAAQKMAAKIEPGKKPHVPEPPKPPAKPPAAHVDDGKSKGKKEPKSEPPSECCPKNKAPANKPVKGKKPIHFGTGQEVLHQTDFVTAGIAPIDWTRCYRSGAETEDWSMFGARWSSAFTTSVSLTAQGCVVHDATGRALRLPHLAPGQFHDESKEGFVLKRDDADSFSLTWRDGSRDTFMRGVDGSLPHGYDGVNPMLAAGAPVRTERFMLTHSAARDGGGVSIAAWPDAMPGELLLRVSDDHGTVIEAMRDGEAGERPRIGRVDEVLDDGTRICHVRYSYALDPGAESPDSPLNLVSQTDVLGHSRTYSYHHHLLAACTSYGGFAQVLEWVSLAALRARWSGSASAADYPITAGSSYQARAIASRAADGSEGAGIVISYLDMDTTRVCENGDVLDYTFDSNWLVTDIRRVKDGVSTPLGSREWDRNGMLLADTDSLGRTTRFSYDAAGNLTSSVDAAGHTTRIAYDAANQPVSVTDPLGHVTRRTFDAAGRLASVTNPLGHATSFRYDDKGQLVEQADAKGGINRFEYDKAGRLRTSTDCSGHATKYHYDERGRVAAVIAPDAAPGQQSRYTYDALGRLITLTRPDGTSDRYAYDPDDNLLAHTDAMGHQTRYRYNGQGLLIERIDAIGQKVGYRYDTALRLVELANAKDERYLLSYDVDGALTSETGFDGKVTNYIYDKAGQLTASVCAGQRTDLIRDTRGLLIAKTNADGIVRFAYDALGRMVAVAAPQAEHRFAYDALGQLIEERAAYYLVTPPVVPAVDGSRVPDAGFVMTHDYDELGNRIRTTLPNGRRVDTLRYGSGHWHGTQWQGESIVDVESDGRYRERKRHLGRGAAGQRLTATREYDPQPRVSRMTLARPADGPNGKPLRDRTFGYDAVGNLLTIEHGDTLGTFRYTYDPVGQLLSAAQPGLTETFVFDPAGNLLDPGRAQTEAAGPTVASKLPVITGNLLKTMFGHTYRYDAQGNVIAKHSAAGVSGNPGHASDLALEYDADNRLRRSVRSEHSRRHAAEYFYDAFSRRVAKCVVAETWRLTQQPERDAPGSVTTATTLFVWDGDVLAQELSRDETLTYLYEPGGFVPMARITSLGGYGCLTGEHAERLERTNTTVVCVRGGNTDTAVWAINLWPVQQWMLSSSTHAHVPELLEQDDNKAEAASKTEWKKRQRGADADALTDRIGYYNCDQLGTPRELVTETGQVIWAERFKAWGRAFSDSQHPGHNAETQLLRFQGQYEDTETGLSYNRYRYYDPDTGRYLTQDPIGLLGGLNAYAYAPNPICWFDPTGLKRTCPVAPTCDPCAGKNPAAWARQWQGHGAYEGRDNWKNMVLSEGTEIYGGAPGQSGFYFDQGTLDKSGNFKSTLWKSLQVLENRKFGYRPAVQKYRLKKDTCVAVSIAEAQISTPDSYFGDGGGTQYFLSDFRQRLNAVGPRINLK